MNRQCRTSFTDTISQKSLTVVSRTLLSFIWASYSSLKYFTVVRTGFGAVWPRPQIVFFFYVICKFQRSSISPSLPFPCVILSSISSILFTYTAECTFTARFILSKIQKESRNINHVVLSSSTIRPPEPIIAPVLFICW